MINKDRIVPVEKIDLLSLYGLVLKQVVALEANPELVKLEASNVEGDYAITSTPDNTLIADQPVKSVDIATGVSSAVLYFVPAYDYAGFSLNGVAVEASGEVEADGCTLYKAELADSAITITKVGF